MGWYDADDIGQTFHCQRCRTMAIVDHTVIRDGANDATWYYSLQEFVYQALDHNFIAPMLAVGHLSSGKQSALWMSEHEIQPATGLKFEADIWMIIEGNVVVGETKSNGTLGTIARQAAKEATKYRTLADIVTADRVVFASSAPWNETSRTAVADTFATHRVRPEIIEL